MDEVLDCPLCFERYNTEARRPKILPCGHTFCLACLCANDNKCSTCRAPFKGTPNDFPDNYSLLSASDNNLIPKKKKFWCLDCKKEASTECEDKHTICGMKKILTEQVGEVSEEAKKNLEEEVEVLKGLLEKLCPLQNSFFERVSARLQQEVNGHVTAEGEIRQILETIPRLEKNPKEDSVDLIKEHLSKSLERLPILKERLNLLQLTENCVVSVKSGDSNNIWDLKLDMSAEHISNEEKALFYLLYVLVGRQKHSLPEIMIPNFVAAAASVSVPSSPSATPHGRCIVQISTNGQQRGQLTIALEEEIKADKRDLIQKGINGLKLYPKKGVLTGCMRSDMFLKGNRAPIMKGSVAVARSPLHPLYIFVDNLNENKPKVGMYVWGHVIENLSFLETILKDCVNQKIMAVVSNARWA